MRIAFAMRIFHGQWKLKLRTHNKRKSTILDKPAAARLRTTVLQNHNGFGLGVEQVSSLHTYSDVITQVVKHRTIHKACVIIP